MIVSTILGLVMNIVMVDNATGQNLTRAILLHKKVLEIHNYEISEYNPDKKEPTRFADALDQHQIMKKGIVR